MGRYANRTTRLEFPDLSEEGDMIYVTIRNPKTVPADVLIPQGDVAVDDDGKPTDSEAAMSASYEVMCKLITEWHVYDGTAEEDDSPPLELPATPEKLRKLPFEILTRIAGELGQVLTTPR